MSIVAGATSCVLVTELDALRGDGGVDASIEAAADAKADGTWCDGVDAAFCEDFDRSTDLPDVWLVAATDGAQSTRTIDPFDFCSAPRALRLATKDIDASGRNTQGLSTLTSIPLNGARHVVVEANLKLRKGEPLLTPSTGLAMFSLAVNAQFGDRVVVNRQDVVKLFLPQLGDAGTGFAGTRDFVIGECARVVLDVVLAPAAQGGRVVLSQWADGGLVVLADTGPVDFTLDTPSTVTLNLGINNTGLSSTATGYLVDDVVVRTIP